ncbi:MAG: SMP-30/gluconolactonase/LRE family protein [Azospirillaceae bacterium]
MSEETAVRLVADARAELGEGPLWCPDRQVLFWVDIPAGAVHRFDPATGTDTVLPGDTGEPVACLARRASGGYLLATARRVLAFDGERIDAGGEIAWPLANETGTRLNDGKVDPAGRLWIGSNDQPEAVPRGHLFRIDPDASVTEIDGPFVVSNGPAFSTDGTAMYFAESFAATIWRYPVDASGNVGDRAVFARLPEGAGFPDGLTVDAEGFVWNAHWAGWRITRYAPDGTIDREIPIPAANVTSCCFGGPDLATLYVTTARVDTSDADLARAPHAGGLFALEPGVAGRVEPAFAG